MVKRLTTQFRAKKRAAEKRRRLEKRINDKKRIKNIIGKKYADELNKRHTPAELEFEKILKEMGIKYYTNFRLFTEESLYLLDFYVSFGNWNYGFEIDGGYHRKQRDYDLERDRFILYRHKIRVYRFTNNQVFNEQEFVRGYIKKLMDSD